MKRKALGFLAMSLCLSWGFSTSAMAQDPTKHWLRDGPYLNKDTAEIQEQMQKARDVAGDDYYLVHMQRLQCADVDDNYTIDQTPGANVLPADSRSTGWAEARAVPTQVFDNVYYVGGMEVGGWIIDTGAGLIMLDSSYDYGATAIIETSMQELGLDPADIKYILLTHAGPDHVGATKYFQDTYGTEVIYNRLLSPATFPGAPAWLVNVPNVTVMNDGDTLTLGNTTITIVYTPRTVGGDGFSYLIPVEIMGESHLWATFGNTGLVGTIQDKMEYLRSMQKFRSYVRDMGADIALSSHPFVDQSLDRMEIIRECDDTYGAGDRCGLNNPFLIGKSGAKKYFRVMYECAKVQRKRQMSGLNNTGLECLTGYEVDANTNTCVEATLE